MALRYYVASDGNFGNAEGLAEIRLTSEEADFIADLTDEDRYKVAQLVVSNSDQPYYDVFSAHAALESMRES
jgi:hypothetical protein